MKDDLKCSFVVPGFQCDSFIFRAIDSILDQDYRNYEIIPVLNGQWETKVDLISGLKEKYKDKINLQSIDQSGLANANNFGFGVSTGDVVSHLSSDLYLVPGALRNWVEAFNDHPDCGVVYSGYRFVSPNPKHIYYSNPFDRYLLECEPFIDGASPYRRRVGKRWNTELKSLIDWDFTLSLTDDGTKGWWIKEPMYWAELPKRGGLSDDSDRNWVKRRRQIQLLHHIPERTICIAAPERWMQALEIAKMCDFDFRMYPGHKSHEYSLIYSYGFPVGEEAIQYSTGIFMRHFGHKIIHWTENDIMSLLNWPMKDVLYYSDMVLKRINYHFCMQQKQHSLLMRLGLNPEIIYPPIPERERPQLRDRTVSINDDGLVDQLKKAMPDIEIRLNDPTCSISVHFQDDISNTLEAVIRGQFVITNDYLPDTHRIEGFENIPELRKMLVHTIRRIIKANEDPDEIVIKRYRAKTKVEFFKGKLERIAEKKVSKYGKIMELQEANA